MTNCSKVRTLVAIDLLTVLEDMVLIMPDAILGDMSMTVIGRDREKMNV